VNPSLLGSVNRGMDQEDQAGNWDVTANRAGRRTTTGGLYWLWGLSLSALAVLAIFCWLMVPRLRPVTIRVPDGSYEAPSSVLYTDPRDRREYLAGHKDGWRYAAENCYATLDPLNGDTVTTASTTTCYASVAYSLGFGEGETAASRELEKRVSESKRWRRLPW
jgi:hypothetical protein